MKQIRSNNDKIKKVHNNWKDLSIKIAEEEEIIELLLSKGSLKNALTRLGNFRFERESYTHRRLITSHDQRKVYKCRRKIITHKNLGDFRRRSRYQTSQSLRKPCSAVKTHIVVAGMVYKGTEGEVRVETRISCSYQKNFKKLRLRQTVS